MKSARALWYNHVNNLFMAQYLATQLTAISLPDWEGRPVRLGSLWEKQPCVLVFLRHYG
jgi:hypothetical protein